MFGYYGNKKSECIKSLGVVIIINDFLFNLKHTVKCN